MAQKKKSKSRPLPKRIHPQEKSLKKTELQNETTQSAVTYQDNQPRKSQTQAAKIPKAQDVDKTGDTASTNTSTPLTHHENASSSLTFKSTTKESDLNDKLDHLTGSLHDNIIAFQGINDKLPELRARLCDWTKELKDTSAELLALKHMRNEAVELEDENHDLEDKDFEPKDENCGPMDMAEKGWYLLPVEVRAAISEAIIDEFTTLRLVTKGRQP